MTSINDLVAGGYDPLQDFTAEHDLHARYVRFAVRSDKRDDKNRHGWVEGTPGDRIGDFMWLYKGQAPPLLPYPPDSSPLPRDREIPAWSPVFPAKVTKTSNPTPQAVSTGPIGAGNGQYGQPAPFTWGGSTTTTGSGPAETYGGPVAPGGGPGDQVEITPILELDQEDDRFEPLKVEGTGLTKGRRGVTVQGTHDGKQAELFFPEAEPLKAVNFNGDPKTASIVYDEDKDSKPDPKRWAWLHSDMRVVRPKEDLAPDKVPLATGATSNLIARQYARAGRDGLAGFGLVADSPRPGQVVTAPTSSGGGRLTTQSRSPVPGTLALAQSLQKVKGDQYTSAIAGTFGLRSPTDAMPFNDAQRLLWQYRSNGYDVEIEMVTRNDNSFKTGAFTDLNLYKLVFKSTTPYSDYTQEKGKPKPAVLLAVGAMSAFANGPIDAGGPGCPHELGTGYDGVKFYSAHISTDAYYRSQGFDGPLAFEGYLDRDPPPMPLRSRVHLVWNGGLSHDHVTGQKNGKWVWVAECMDYVTPDRPPRDPRDPTDGGIGDPPDPNPPNGPGEGTWERPPGSPYEFPMCDPPSKAIVQKQYRASPFAQVSSAIYLRAQNYAVGDPDTRHVQPMTDALLRAIDSAPMVARIEAFGNRTGGDWQRANEVSGSSFPGGSANGGIFVAPPEIDPKNIINNTVTETTNPTNTAWIFHPDVFVGRGTPASNGTVASPERFLYVPSGTPATKIPQSNGDGTVSWITTPSGTTYPVAPTGGTCSATGTGSLAIGNGSDVKGDKSKGIGDNAFVHAGNHQSNVLGYNAAIGSLGGNSAIGGTAMGYQTLVDGTFYGLTANYGAAFGWQAWASGDYGLALGHNANAGTNQCALSAKIYEMVFQYTAPVIRSNTDGGGSIGDATHRWGTVYANLLKVNNGAAAAKGDLAVSTSTGRPRYFTAAQVEADTPAAEASVDADGLACALVIRKSFAAGAGGAADDVTIYSANAPFGFRVLSTTLYVSTGVAAATVTARTASGGTGTALSDALAATTTGVQRDAALTATGTVASGGSLYLRRSDNGVAGEIVLTILKT